MLDQGTGGPCDVHLVFPSIRIMWMPLQKGQANPDHLPTSYSSEFRKLCILYNVPVMWTHGAYYCKSETEGTVVARQSYVASVI
jgi:hypothetical protein